MKKLLSIILAVLMAITVFPLTVSAETNKKTIVYHNYDLGQDISGGLSKNVINRYNFSVDKTTKLTVNFSASVRYCSILLLDNAGNTIYGGGGYTSGSSNLVKASATFIIAKGNYHIDIFADTDYTVTGYNYTYNMATATEEVKDDLPEEQNGSNNTFDTAFAIDINKKYDTAFLRGDVIEYYDGDNQNHANDGYKITLPQSGNLDFIFNGDVYYTEIKIYDESETQIYSKNTYVSSNGINSREIKLDLNAGSYYIMIGAKLAVDGWRPDHFGEYSIETVFTSSDETVVEYQNGQNETKDTATLINLSKLHSGFVASNEEYDWHKISLAKDSEYVFWAKANIYYSIIDVLNSNDETLESLGGYAGVTSGIRERSYTSKLSAGDYYIKVKRSYENTGSYQLLCAPLGDVNTDGVITVADATLIQKYLADISEFESYQTVLAKVNGSDEKVTVSSATNIQKYLAGINATVSGK